MSLLGSKAPTLQLYDDEAQLFDLSEQVGKNVLILFYPAAFSGVCTTELNMVNNDLENYGDTVIVGVSTDAPSSQAEFRKINALNSIS